MAQTSQGLHEGDLIVRFGSVTKENFSSLADIARVVEHSAQVRAAVICFALLQPHQSHTSHTAARLPHTVWEVYMFVSNDDGV